MGFIAEVSQGKDPMLTELLLPTESLGCFPDQRRHMGAESSEDTTADTAKGTSCSSLPARTFGCQKNGFMFCALDQQSAFSSS